MASTLVPSDWEAFDAEALFPPPRLHVNKLTKIDKVDLEQSDQSMLGEQSQNPSSDSQPKDGDMMAPVNQETGHEDQLFEMEGNGGQADDREIQADREEDHRSKEPEDSKEPEGADKPIQKKSEGVEEVAEATSKLSEDVHGGDEATKDIKDSPNAADDGENPDNHGAESGEGGQDGQGDEGEGSETGMGTSNGDQESNDPLESEDWEARADQVAGELALENSLDELEAKVRDESGHRTSLPTYHFNREQSPVELEIAFQKGRELIAKLAAEEDFAAKIVGPARWDAKQLAREVVRMHHPHIPSARYDRPREADIVMLLDISGSCAEQAEMFMAIAAGAVNYGVRIFVGYNGSCRCSPMQPPKRLPRKYEQAKTWVQSEVERVSGWDNQVAVGEWSFREFVEEIRPKTLVIFGDWDGIDQYQDVVPDPKFHSTKFFWFANEGRRDDSRPPKGLTKKNYFSHVYSPKDLVRALRRLH